MAEEMLNGFDHTQYKDEVEQRWGKEAYAKSDAWWRAQGAAERADFTSTAQQLMDDWRAAAHRGEDPAGEVAQSLAQRQLDWLRSVPGTPQPEKEYFTGLGDMYVADERFAANYGGLDGATFVRDSMRIYAHRNL